MKISVKVKSDIDLTTRVKQVASLFDCPAKEKVG